MKKTLFVITILSLTLLSCSTTRNLPEGETLYTGIKKITVVDQKTKTGVAKGLLKPSGINILNAR